MDANSYRLADRMCAVPGGKEKYMELWGLTQYRNLFSDIEADRIRRIREILDFFNKQGFSDREVENALRL